MKPFLLFLGYALIAIGLGLVIACGFGVQATTRWLAGGGLVLLAAGGGVLFTLKGRQARTSIISWTGPAAVAFVIGLPLLIGLGVLLWLRS